MVSEPNIFERMAAALLKRWPDGKWRAYEDVPSTGATGHLPSGAWVVIEAEWEQAGAPKGLHVTAERDGFDCCMKFETEAGVVDAVARCEAAVRATLEEVA